MLKKYIERAVQDGAPQQKSDDYQAMLCDVCTGIMGENEDLSVNDDEMMELADCHQKETVQNVKLGIKLTITQQEETMNTLSRHVEVFSDIPGKTNIILLVNIRQSILIIIQSDLGLILCRTPCAKILKNR